MIWGGSQHHYGVVDALGWNDLATSKVTHIAIANPMLAPYGLAAKQVLQSDPAQWRTLEPKLVYGENVRQALQFAATGNADVCLTSYTLVRNQGGVLADPRLYKPIAQAAGVVRRPGGNSAWAKRLLDALLSARGQELLTRYGLRPAVIAAPSARK